MHLAHAVSWDLKAGKMDASRTGGLTREQEGTELQETALRATQQPGLERTAWTETARHLPGSRGAMYVICIAVRGSVNTVYGFYLKQFVIL